MLQDGLKNSRLALSFDSFIGSGEPARHPRPAQRAAAHHACEKNIKHTSLYALHAATCTQCALCSQAEYNYAGRGREPKF